MTQYDLHKLNKYIPRYQKQDTRIHNNTIIILSVLKKMLGNSIRKTIRTSDLLFKSTSDPIMRKYKHVLSFYLFPYENSWKWN